MNTNLIDMDTIIAQANELTALPQSTVRLAGLVEKKQDNVAEVVDVVAFDPALTFRLIRSANSAYSGSSQPVTSVREAVARLGTKQTFALAVVSSVRPHMQQTIPEYGLNEGDFWRHSVAAAVVTEIVQPFCKVLVPEEAFTAALLHDVGKLVIARALSPEVLALLQQAQSDGGLTPLEAELKILNVHHGELGGIIAQHWQFPQRIVNGIIHHHNPDEGADPVCDFVYLANIAAKMLQARLLSKKLELIPEPDVCQRLGMAADGFEKLVEAAVQRFEEVRTRYNVK